MAGRPPQRDRLPLTGARNAPTATVGAFLCRAKGAGLDSRDLPFPAKHSYRSLVDREQSRHDPQTVAARHKKLVQDPA